MGSPKGLWRILIVGVQMKSLNCIDRGNRGPNLDLLSKRMLELQPLSFMGEGSDRKEMQYKQLDMALIGLRLMPAGALHQKK